MRRVSFARCALRGRLQQQRWFGSTPSPSGMKELSESWSSGTSANYMEAMYQSYLQDPSSVHVSWRTYFANLDAPAGERVVLPFEQVGAASAGGSRPSPPSLHVSGPGSIDTESFKLSLLIRSYQVRGHRLCDLDPLGLAPKPYINYLDPEYYGFTEKDMDREVKLSSIDRKYVSGFLAGANGKTTLRELISRLQTSYSKFIGLEYMHIQDLEEVNWIRSKMETQDPVKFSPEEKKVILDRLMWAEMFERFLASKWATAKRFGLEGGEALIPGVKAMIDTAVDLGVTNVIMGMPHRGRLVTLATILRKPMESIFAEFGGGVKAKLGSGDVKYHLGTSFTRPTRSGKTVYLSLLSNPSHLEAVNPCVMGKARAKQDALGDEKGEQVMPILFHGDASFAGQGIVYETMNFWELEGYKVGGTVHVVVNNQVGFTTDPKDSRSSPYCTAVAKAVDAPIFHVNGNHPEEVVHCFNLAAEFRQKFHKDVVIDLVCYRRLGHNEMDEPKFTQPLMYDVIQKMPTTLALYSQRLQKEGVVTEESIKEMSSSVRQKMEEAFVASKTYEARESDWLASKWEGFKSPLQISRIMDTGVPQDKLRSLGLALSRIPEKFKAHKNILATLKARKEMFEGDRPVDWTTAELLAYATLVSEGNRVRISGQDVQRGTFTHRHAIITDQETGEKYNMLDGIEGPRAAFYCYNSSLSEFGVLGFELGYAGEDPNQLVVWEAQFGDFANSAQVMIDQFIASGEAKWLRQAGLTMLLPHGYDGQGPEHSSARLERYLQLVDSDPFVIPPNLGTEDSTQTQLCNMQVAMPTTPANFFHLLRRQVHRKFRKPLIVITPKNLYRHPAVVSPLSEFDDKADVLPSNPVDFDTRFRRVIGEGDQKVFDQGSKVKRLIFCSGKIYYELLAERTKRELSDVAIVRLEQLAPFPFDLVQRQHAHFSNAEVCWVQEEPYNAGAYSFVAPHFRTAFSGVTPMYIGRPSAAATATGSAKVHAEEQSKLIGDAFDLPYTKY